MSQQDFSSSPTRSIHPSSSPDNEPDAPEGRSVNWDDPDVLHKLGGPKYGRKRWTFGSSATLVQGADVESPWVGVAWIVVPTGLAALVLWAMIYA